MAWFARFLNQPRLRLSGVLEEAGLIFWETRSFLSEQRFPIFAQICPNRQPPPECPNLSELDIKGTGGPVELLQHEFYPILSLGINSRVSLSSESIS